MSNERLERTKEVAREQWGDAWTVRALHFADGSVRPVAFRSLGVDREATEASEGTVVERERLWVGEDGEEAVIERVLVRQREVLDVLDERELDGPGDS